ncbi:hypothetical protein H6503_02805 [Candidatus Woesearchaeota archaeon]|nr:hypothetical protein [Candidatus Woesearchaeota archaeon]
MNIGRARNCIKGLEEDLREIEDNYIRKGDFEKAAEQWEFCLQSRQFYGLRDDIINGLHCGLTVYSAAEMVLENLQKGRTRKSLEMFRAFASQSRLPDGSHIEYAGQSIDSGL